MQDKKKWGDEMQDQKKWGEEMQDKKNMEMRCKTSSFEQRCVQKIVFLKNGFKVLF